MSSPSSLVIVGGGVVGLCCAWYAAREGHRVVVLERDGPERDSCSLGNSGLVVPSHFVPLAAPGVTRVALRSLLDRRSPLRLHPRLAPDYLRWCWRFWRSANPGHVTRSAPALRDLSLLSLRCYDELAAEWRNPFGLSKEGLLMLSRTQHGFDEEARQAEQARALGIDAEILDANQAAQREPAIRMSVAGAVRYPMDAHLNPQSFVAEMTRRLASAGVQIRCSTPVTGWRRAGDRVAAACTPEGEVAADQFVLAGGVWSMQLARELGLRLPLEAGKGYSLTLPRPRAQPRMSAILTEARIAVTPMGTSLRFGGTLQLAGLERGIDPRRVNALLEAIPRYYPDFSRDDFDGVQPWSGLRPCSPDGLPYIGRPHSVRNVLVGAGHAMMGLCLAPATGLVLSELLAGRRPSAPLEQFAVDRFRPRR